MNMKTTFNTLTHTTHLNIHTTRTTEMTVPYYILALRMGQTRTKQFRLQCLNTKIPIKTSKQDTTTLHHPLRTHP